MPSHRQQIMDSNLSDQTVYGILTLAVLSHKNKMLLSRKHFYLVLFITTNTYFCVKTLISHGCINNELKKTYYILKCILTELHNKHDSTAATDHSNCQSQKKESRKTVLFNKLLMHF